MVFMVVGQEDSIKMRDLFTEHLLPEIRAGVDQEGLAQIADERRAAEAVVARVVGGAHFAVATDHRDALGGAGAEKGYGIEIPGQARNDVVVHIVISTIFPIRFLSYGRSMRR